MEPIKKTVWAMDDDFSKNEYFTSIEGAKQYCKESGVIFRYMNKYTKYFIYLNAQKSGMPQNICNTKKEAAEYLKNF